jgi:hypothetical protein
MADTESQSATSIQVKPSASDTGDPGVGRPVQENGNRTPPPLRWGPTVALSLILLTFFVFLSQLVVELIVGLLR